MNKTSTSLALVVTTTILLIGAAKAEEGSCEYLASAIEGIERSSAASAAHIDELNRAHFVLGSDVKGAQNRSCVLSKAQVLLGNGRIILQAFGPRIALVRKTFSECKTTVEENGGVGLSAELTRFVLENSLAQATQDFERQFQLVGLDMSTAQNRLTPALLTFLRESPTVPEGGLTPECVATYDEIRAGLEQAVTSGFNVRRLDEFNYSNLSSKTGNACAALPERMYKKIDSTHYPKISVSQFEFNRWVGEGQNYFGIEGGRLFWHRNVSHFFSLEGLHFYLETGFTFNEALKFIRENPIKDPDKPLTDYQQRMMAAYRKYGEIASTASYESIGLDTPILCGDGSERARYTSWNARLHGLNSELDLGKDLRNVPLAFKR